HIVILQLEDIAIARTPGARPIGHPRTESFAREQVRPAQAAVRRGAETVTRNAAAVDENQRKFVTGPLADDLVIKAAIHFPAEGRAIVRHGRSPRLPLCDTGTMPMGEQSAILYP